MGARRAGRESDSPAGGSRFDCDIAKGRGRAVRTRRVARATRSASSSQATLETASPEATFRRFRTVCLVRSRLLVCLSLAKRRCAMTTPSSVASVPRGSSFRFTAASAQPVPALKPGDIPIQWSHDGRYVYTVDNVGGVRSPAVDVFRVEITTGARVLWKTLTPSDPVGVEGLRAHRGDHTGRAVVLLLLHATAWRPVRRRRAQVTRSAARSQLELDPLSGVGHADGEEHVAVGIEDLREGGAGCTRSRTRRRCRRPAP